jgi:hypothetical protein
VNAEVLVWNGGGREEGEKKRSVFLMMKLVESEMMRNLCEQF